MRYSGAVALAAALPPSVLASHHERVASRLIPGTNETLPIVGLGNSVSFRDEDLSIASKLSDVLLGQGGSYIDVGGVSRFSVGQLAREKGATDKLFLGNYLDPNDEQAMHEEARTVARGQGKDALDLVHTRDLQGYRAQIGQYRALKAAGLVRYIGVARSGQRNFDAIMKLIDDGLVDFVQINYSMLEPKAADRLLPLARDQGVAVNISRPFINGRYFGMVSGQVLPDWAAEFDCESWAQFSLKFILAHPAVNCVLTETANPAHALDNLGAGHGRLPDAATRQRMLNVMQNLV